MEEGEEGALIFAVVVTVQVAAGFRPLAYDPGFAPARRRRGPTPTGSAK